MRVAGKIRLTAAMAVLAAGIPANAEAPFRTEFTAKFCAACHGGEDPQGGFRADTGPHQAADAKSRRQWKLAGEYVSKGVMPPVGAPQPSRAGRERFSDSVADGLAEAESTNSSHAVVRRLNRIEYLNTLRDLFQIREIRLPVTFPDDNSGQQFDTMTEETYLTPGHLDAFHEVAIDIADRMVPLPSMQQRRVEAERHSIGSDPARTPKYWFREGDDTGLYFTGINMAGWSGALWVKAFAAHASGVYRVRLKVSAEAEAGADGKPLRLGFYAFNPGDYELPKRALRIDLPKVGSVEVTNQESGIVETDLLLEKGETVHFYCENRLRREYPPALVREPGNVDGLRRLLATYLEQARASPEPTIRFERVEITGPVGPLPRQVQFLGGGKPMRDRAYIESILLPLAERAFRRPLTGEESDQLISSVLEHLQSSPSAAYGIHYGIRRILLSPQFLYRETGGGDLGDYGLASRLAYFLWSTMPDSKLLQVAGKGLLSEEGEVAAQVRRMVRDPKAQQFVRHFSGQWLGGRKAASVMVCDVRHVWSELIRHGIVRSTEMFFNEILQGNRSIRDFIDSDFTYANEPMRIAWGIPGNEVDLLRLEADQRQSLLWPEPQRLDLTALGPEVPTHVGKRGGVLGLSGVFAATGDGVESSPILRGVWVLENLFGTPPPPPPSEVPALVADVSQTKTVRELLAAHQSVESCAVCHAEIDPIGLALENYDAVGGWRTEYYQEDDSSAPASPIETVSEMPDGTRLGSAQDIKDYLMARPEQFTRTLATLLLEYGTGRELTSADELAVDEIVAAEPAGGYGFQDLIARLVASKAFAQR